MPLVVVVVVVAVVAKDLLVVCQRDLRNEPLKEGTVEERGVEGERKYDCYARFLLHHPPPTLRDGRNKITC